MKLPTPRTAILLFIALALVFSTLFFFSLREREYAMAYTIELREEGFYPEELRIQKGDTVIFSTTRGAPFWPASNLHPSHTIYPEFDPKEPIDPGKAWSFRFNKVGNWKYHDHLAPLFRGEIMVSEKVSTCKNKDYDKQCWEQVIATVVKTEGVEAALNVLQDNLAFFPNDCHDLSHVIGEEAYRVFSEQKSMVLSSKTYYCGYGFFHGFMETLLQTTGNAEEARDFCAYADTQLAGKTGDAGGSCYHGIGHGTVDGGDPRNWGNAKAVIAQGLDICERVGSTDTQIDRCASGVFNSLAIAYNSSSYGLSLPRENPYGICKEQAKPYFKKPCYEEMNTTVIRLGNSFADAARHIESIGEDVYANYAMEALAGYAVFFYPKYSDPGQQIADCRSLQARLRIPCIKGFAAGRVEHAGPEAEYVESLAFCASTLLTSEERQACFNRIIPYLSLLYPPEKLHEICKTLKEEYQKYCPDNV